jgi:hypothetical protein
LDGSALRPVDPITHESNRQTLIARSRLKVSGNVTAICLTPKGATPPKLKNGLGRKNDDEFIFVELSQSSICELLPTSDRASFKVC